MSGFSDQSQAELGGSECLPLRATLRLGPGGRVVVPANIREAMGLKQGDALVAELNGGKLVMEALADRIKELQALTAKYVPTGVSLVDEYLVEKRAEQAREDLE